MLIGALAETKHGSVFLKVLIQLVLILLHVDDHLQVVQLLSLLQVLDCVDERLFSHGHDLLADVLDNVVLKLLVLVDSMSSIFHCSLTHLVIGS